MFQSNIYYFMSIKGYIVSIEKSVEFYLCLWSSIFVYGFLSLYAVVGCMYMDTFGCMYADVGCKYADVGCKVCGCWVQSMRYWVQVCGVMWVQSMRLLGASFITAESLPDSR